MGAAPLGQRSEAALAAPSSAPSLDDRTVSLRNIERSGGSRAALARELALPLLLNSSSSSRHGCATIMAVPAVPGAAPGDSGTGAAETAAAALAVPAERQAVGHV